VSSKFILELFSASREAISELFQSYSELIASSRVILESFSASCEAIPELFQSYAELVMRYSRVI
jgi:hypothetical protein